MDVSFSYERVSWEAESPEAYLALQEHIQGNVIAARRALGTGRPWPRLRQQLLEVLEAGNEDPSGFRVASTALVAMGRRRKPSEGA